MRLLNVCSLQLESFDRLPPRYAIASHRWIHGAESSFQDVQAKRNHDRLGYRKICQFAAFVRDHVHGVEYLWVDTCCIDKTNSNELQEAITAMYRWYESAVVCLAYLDDVRVVEELEKSAWFTRGWTLQELVAPGLVLFLSMNWEILGHKAQDNSGDLGPALDQLGPRLNTSTSTITNIPELVIAQPEQRKSLSVEERLRWMDTRTTTRPEDMAYSLLGLFEVFIPPMYGEGRANAQRRLTRAIAEANEGYHDRKRRKISFTNYESRIVNQAEQQTIHTQNVYQSHRHSTREEAGAQGERINLFLRKLYQHTYPYEDRKNRNTKPVKGTCQWFATHEIFQSWASPQRHPDPNFSLLYVTADPGCGKSVLSRHLIDTILPQEQEDRTICYAFFKDDFEDQKTSLGAVCALLHQLLFSNRDVFEKEEEILKIFESQGDRYFESFASVWKTFIAAAAYRAVVCVLDALDECHGNDRLQLLTAIGELPTPGLRFLLVSRPYEHIVREVRHQCNFEISSIHIQGDRGPTAKEIAREIQLVVEHRIDQAANTWRLSMREKQLLRETIQTIPNRTYLWITLVFDGLMKQKKGIGKKEILDLTTKLPRGVYEAYENLLAKGQDEEKMKKLLSFVLAAKRPLSLAETATFLACHHQQCWSDLVDDIIPAERVHEEIRDICGLFISVVDGKLYLLHQTAREFLISAPSTEMEDISHTSLLPTEPKLKWQHSISLPEANEVLARSCINVLGLCLFKENAWNDQPSKRIQPVLKYCSEFWPMHYRQSSIPYRTVAMGIALIFCIPSMKRIKWLEYNGELYLFSPNASALHLASALGLIEVVQQLLLALDQGDLDCVDEEDQTALYWAASYGREEVVEMLLDNGAEVNAEGGDYGNALQAASSKGHMEVVKLLLDNEAEVNAQGGVYGNALYAASSGGYAEIVKMLIDNEAEVNAEGGECGNALYAASSGGYAEVVKLLLDNGADVNAKGDELGNVLHAASSGGHAEIVKMLLDNGAEVNAGDECGNALYAASSGGYAEIVKLLLDNNAEVNAEGGFYSDALQAASSGGHVEIVKLLLDKGAKVKTQEGFDDNALQAASNGGLAETVEFLIEKAASPMHL